MPSPAPPSPYDDLPFLARQVVDLATSDVLHGLPVTLQRALGRLRHAVARVDQASSPPTPELVALADMIERGTSHSGYVTIQISGGAYRDLLVDHLRHPRWTNDALASLIAERDDADRRAGAAERDLVDARDRLSVLNDVRRQMKRAAGYDDAVSFDDVWAAVLAKAAAWDKYQGAKCDSSAAT